MGRRRKKGGRPPQKQPADMEHPSVSFTFKNLPQDGNMALLGAQIAWLIENTYQFDVEANDIRGYYETVADHASGSLSLSDDEWESPEDRQKCIDANFMIVVRCYPRGSVSFYVARGSDLSRIVQRVYDVTHAELSALPNEWRAKA